MKGQPKTPGSGRKPTGAKMRSFRLTDEHYKLVREYVRKLKAAPVNVETYSPRSPIESLQGQRRKGLATLLRSQDHGS